MFNKLRYKDLTDVVISSFFDFYNSLGYGFLEKVYENARFYELSQRGLFCVRQSPIQVFYKGLKVGKYYADIIVEEKVILEIKAVDGLVEEHEYQLINYLKTTEIEVGLLLNFGKNPQFKRKIYENGMERGYR